MAITVQHMPNLSTYSQAIIEAAKRQEEEQRSLAGAQLSLGAISARRPAPTYGGGGGGGSTGGTSAYQQRMLDEANSLAFQQRAMQNVGSLYPQQQAQQPTAAPQPVMITNPMASQQPSGGFNWSGLGSSLYDFFLNPK